jgi:PAS domain S-box-containing protein
MEEEHPFQINKSFEALLQSVTDYVVGINRDYQIIMANDLFKKEFGFQQEGFCFKGWKKRDEKCDVCPVEKSFQDGRVHTTQQAVVMKDGRSAQMLITSTPVKDDRGEIAYVLETATDITGKKHLQNELNRIAGDLDAVVVERLRDLQKSEERYRTIVERSRDAILLTDAKGKILEINQAGLEMLGYKTKDDYFFRLESFEETPSAEIAESGQRAEHQSVQSAGELFENEEDLDRFKKRIFDAGFVPEFEARLVGKRGQVFDALITANVILDVIGQITGYVMIIRDITKKKQAQEQIKRRNIQLAALNAISMTLTSSLDPNEVLKRTVEKMLEILEPDSVRIYLLDKDRNVLELVAHKGLSKGFVDEPVIKNRKAGDGLLGETVTSGKPRVVDNLQRSKDPYVQFLVREGLQSSVYMPLVSRGEPVGAMVVSSHSGFRFSDIYVDYLSAIGSQIGVALENAELYQDLKNAYQELKAAQEQVIASEKLASLGKLSATIAHEINNPLAAVLTYIRLLLKMGKRNRLTSDRMEDILRYLTIMESETARCGEIVKNLLAFSRQSRMAIETHRLEEIIDRTLALISHDLDMREVQLEKQIAADLPPVQCDFRQIQQALLNLMGNASEAMTAGGTLTVRAARSHGDDEVEVVIADTGCGITADDLKHIFEPFYTTKEEGKGVGLGLSVAYGIITRHNGTIRVESEPEKGSLFTVRLPVVQKEMERSR